LRQDRRELDIQLRTKTVHDRKNGECDARSDEAIFIGGRARLVSNERRNFAIMAGSIRPGHEGFLKLASDKLRTC
jgi:hypothetical protein